MTKNTITKLKITLSVFFIYLIYFSALNFLHGGDFSLSIFLPFWWIIPLVYSVVLTFVYPYIKINSQSIFKRGLFFGAVAWIVNFPQILMDLKETVILFDSFSRVIPFFEKPIYFLIIGLLISFFYKKFLTEEFNLSLIKSKISFIKIILAIIITALFYLIFMYLGEFLIINIFSSNPFALKMSFSDFLIIFLYINPLIYGLIFTTLYVKTIRRIDISKVKKMIFFIAFFSVFATPLVIKSPDYYFGDIYMEMFIANLRFVLLIPHLLSVLIISYFFTKFLNNTHPKEDLLLTEQ